MKPQPIYNAVRDTWHPHICPFGDECSHCDAVEYCEQGRRQAAEAAAATPEADE